jgi:subtilisin family serine protease
MDILKIKAKIMLNFLAYMILSIASAEAKPVIIAIIDSGVAHQAVSNHPDHSKIKLCNGVHRNYITAEEFSYYGKESIPGFLVDHHGHGTHIAGIIASQLPRKSNYCFLIMKVFHTSGDSDFKKPLKDALDQGANFINISGGGASFIKEECEILEKVSQNGIVVFTAAGNHAGKLNDNNRFFPASCPKSKVNPHIVVGSADSKGNIHEFSNTGSLIDEFHNGKDVWAVGMYMSGTSQATAVATGKAVKKYLERKNNVEETSGK